MSSGSSNVLGKSAMLQGEWRGSFGAFLAAVRPQPEKMCAQFLSHYLRTPEFRLWASSSSGIGIKNIRASDLKAFQIPLPPLPEQKRIAGILDQADALRRLRARALEKLNTFGQAIFQEMFGGQEISAISVRDNIPKSRHGWSWELLTDVARLATGHTPDRKRPNYWDGDICWISLREIRGLDGKIASHTNIKITEEGIKNSSAVLLPKGTVCLSRTASVGFATIMGKEMATSQDFVNWVCGDRITPHYLLNALISSRKEIQSLATGSTHRTIYFPVVESFKVLLPPMELQKKFEKATENLPYLIKIAEDAALRVENLFASLQHRAFRGEL